MRSESACAVQCEMITLHVRGAAGEHLAALINKIYATPKTIIDRVSNLIK